MKYIEIDINRAVELYRQGKEDKVFRKCDNGELERGHFIAGNIQKICSLFSIFRTD